MLLDKSNTSVDDTSNITEDDIEDTDSQHEDLTTIATSLQERKANFKVETSFIAKKLIEFEFRVIIIE